MNVELLETSVHILAMQRLKDSFEDRLGSRENVWIPEPQDPKSAGS